jgi:MFS family permease
MSASAVSQPARWYLGSVAAFMLPHGLQMVLLPYLLAIELQQPAARFGITQMLGQLPMLLFLLLGGWLADRVDPRRLLMVLHGLAIPVPLLLAFALWRGSLSEALLMVYALSWGLVTAFMTPARDGYLHRVAGHNVQRMVALAMGMQFGMQMVGQTLGGQAGRWGALVLLLTQCALLVLGVFVASRLPPAPRPAAAPAGAAARKSMWAELGGGLSVIAADTPMRATLLMTAGMGVFFGGVFVVLIPLAVRDLFAGGAQDISAAYIAFGIGTLTSIAALTRRGGLAGTGRALVCALLAGCVALSPLLLAPPQAIFYLCIFCWGLCGGVAMSMSRFILQERAPASHQSRVMAAFSLATVGGTPVGALITGLAVGAVGVRWATLMPVLGVAGITLAVLATHDIWQLRARRA